MSKFSDRIGVTTPPKLLHVDGMTPTLRASVWNLMYELYDINYWENACFYFARDFMPSPLDDLPDTINTQRRWLKSKIDSLDWYDVYNLIEFFVNQHPRSELYRGDRQSINEHDVTAEQFRHLVNRLLEREHSGYRFVGGLLSPIVEQVEVDAVDEALRASAASGLDGARVHLTQALTLFAKRPDPDHRNAIKEAISAVESAAQLVGGESELKSALIRLREEGRLHPALAKMFSAAYGYASDEEGVRHAMLDDKSNVGFDEAKFMIVASAAFVSYLAAKSASIAP